ncbi:MAG TPA: YoaK family protein [Stellaceae bacterium]|nr:YoaK family protein [Stellaceae bacterium]
MKLLPTVLSLAAGSVDVISFLGLGGLFAAHITGNLVILAAHSVSGGSAQLAPMLSVPVFIAALGLTRLLASAVEGIGIMSLVPLLGLQLLLLVGFFAVSTDIGAPVNADAPSAVVAGMLGVAAMAVQNALVQISLRGAPATAVMTSNITRFVMDVGTVWLGRDRDEITGARHRAQHAWPAILGFAVGCALGAAAQAAIGLQSLALPMGFALLALVLGLSAKPDSGGQR